MCVSMMFRRAYPRQRGGTWRRSTMPPFLGGPIPASAGEPHLGSFGRNRRRAYPRQRGGTLWRLAWLFLNSGLSPPARGNQCLPVGSCSCNGPIPASAGEPIRARSWMRPGGAYPRQRGGTKDSPNDIRAGRGLSPPARGNRGIAWRRTGPSGPIPASAGEPRHGPQADPGPGAYPRQRGGTPSGPTIRVRLSGLSPPARGNLFEPCHWHLYLFKEHRRE